MSLQSNFSSRKESIEDDASSAAAVMDEEEDRDAFGDLEEEPYMSETRNAASSSALSAVGEAVDSIR